MSRCPILCQVAVASVLVLLLDPLIGTAAANDASHLTLVERVRILAERRDLRLSTAQDEGKPFRFSVTVSGPPLEAMTFTAERNAVGVALVGASATDDLTYCYATNGLVAKLDNTTSGQLLIAREAQFSLVLEGDEQNQANRFNVSLDAGEPSRIVLDLPSTLRSLLPKVEELREDSEGHWITLVTETATVTVETDDVDPDAAKITGLTLETEAGMKLRVHDIAVDAEADVSTVGIESSAFENLKLPKRVGPWTPQIAAAQAPVTPKGFWTRDANRNAGRLLASVVSGSRQREKRDNDGPTTAPSAPAKAMTLDAASMADALDTAVRQALVGQQAAVLEVNPTREQRTVVEQLVRQRKGELEGLLGAVRAEQISRADALQRAGELAVLTEQLQTILTPGQFLAYTKHWLSSVPKHGERNPIRSILGEIADAAAALDLSELQATEIATLLNELDAKSERLRRAYLLGEIDADGVRAVTPAFTTQLIDGLKRILTADQYREIEAILRSNVPKESAATPGSSV